MELYFDEKDNAEEGTRISNSIFGKRKKKFKNSDRGSLGFLLKMMLIAIFVEIYFIINFALESDDKSWIQEFIKEFNYTSFAEGYYSFALNAQKQLFMNDTWTLLNNNSTQ